MPQYLRTRIESQIAQNSMAVIDIFKGCTKEMIGDLRIHLRAIGVNRNYPLFRRGDNASEIYILRIGRAVLYYGGRGTGKESGKKSQSHNQSANDCDESHSDESYRRVLQRGDVVGEECLIWDRRDDDLYCSTWCEFYVLRKDVLKNTLYRHLKKVEADRTWNEMQRKLRRNPRRCQRIKHPESAALLKAKAKANILDTVHDPNKLFNSKEIEIELNENTHSNDWMNNAVNKVREVRRYDSGLKDFEMRQHELDLGEYEENDVEMQDLKDRRSANRVMRVNTHSEDGDQNGQSVPEIGCDDDIKEDAAGNTDSEMAITNDMLMKQLKVEHLHCVLIILKYSLIGCCYRQ